MSAADHKGAICRLAIESDALLARVERSFCGIADAVVVAAGVNLSTVRDLLGQLQCHANTLPQGTEPPADLVDRLAAGRKRVRAP